MAFPVGLDSNAARRRRRPRIGVTSWRSPGDGAGEETLVLNRAYVDAVLAAGGLPLVLPVLAPGDADDVLATVDGLLLTGGGDVDPARYGQEAVPEEYGVYAARDDWELALARAAQVPVLGICRGAQVLNVAAGGTLVPDVPTATGVEHRVRERSREVVHGVTVVAGTLLHAVVGSEAVDVNTLHHQAVDRPGAGFRVVATAPDGTVEAIERADGAALGVQWHPELLAPAAPHADLFGWLVEAAAGRDVAAAVA